MEAEAGQDAEDLTQPLLVALDPRVPKPHSTVPPALDRREDAPGPSGSVALPTPLSGRIHARDLHGRKVARNLLGKLMRPT